MTSPATTQYRPTTVSAPGETLSDLLGERGLSQAELAERMGRPTKTVNEIVKGKATVTRETALQLERVLGVPAEFWLTREARYQEWLVRQEDLERMKGAAGWLKELPLRDMIRFGWLARCDGKAEQVGDCLRFFGVASVEAWRDRYERPLAAFRASRKVAWSKGAVAAWLRQGEIKAAAVPCRPYDASQFREVLPSLRALTREKDPGRFIPILEEACANCGVAVCFVQTPKGCPASGATRWLSPWKAVLQLSLRYKTNDHLWFTFFHEASHIVRHGKKMLFLENAEGLDDNLEREADRCARDLLIPPRAAIRLPQLGWDKAAVVAFADEVGVAPGVVVGRMQREELIPWTHLNGLKLRYEWSDGEGEAQAI